MTTRALLFATALCLSAQSPRIRPAASPYQAPDASALTSANSDLSLLLDRYSSDRRTLQLFYDLPISPATDSALRHFYQAWRGTLDRVNFDALNADGRIEYILFRNKLDQEMHDLDLERKRVEEMAALIPFAPAIVELREARQRVDPLDPAKAAATLARMDKQIEEMLQWASGGKPDAPKVKPTVASRAARTVTALRDVLKRWYQFYDGYDPLFTLVVAGPVQAGGHDLEKYAELLREKLVGHQARTTTSRSSATRSARGAAAPNCATR